MTENLEPADDAAARATRRIMEAAGLQGREGVVLDPEATAAMLGALLITNLGLASFMVEAGRRTLMAALDDIGPTHARLLAEDVFTSMLVSGFRGTRPACSSDQM